MGTVGPPVDGGVAALIRKPGGATTGGGCWGTEVLRPISASTDDGSMWFKYIMGVPIVWERNSLQDVHAGHQCFGFSRH